MGLKEMQIMFDNPWATYYTGSQISGQFTLSLDSPKKVREIKIKFKGEAQIKWSVTETRKDAEGKDVREEVDYTSEETYFENKYVLAGESEIPPGVHKFNFQTILPPQLPSSYEGQFGHIRYTVKVVLDRPWKFNQECKAAFTVICPVDLNYVQEARTPLRIQKEKMVGMCCCKSGPLSISLGAPASGFVSGQTIPITIEAENGTNTNMTSGDCALRKIVTYKATRPSQETKVEKIEVFKFNLSTLGAHATNTWSENIVLPPLPATSTTSCKYLTISYDLKIKTSMSGMFYRGLDFSSPIIIGTVPLMTFGPATPPAAPAPVGGALGWNQGGDANQTYPNLPPPSYEESAFGKATTIQDKDDNEHTQGIGGWVPRYPTFNYAPTAPPLD